MLSNALHIPISVAELVFSSQIRNLIIKEWVLIIQEWVLIKSDVYINYKGKVKNIMS